MDTTLKKLRTADLVSKAKLTRFKKKCQQLVVAMVSKLIEKIPLGTDFLLSLSVPHPPFLSSRPRSKIVLTHILQLKVLSKKCCDEAMSKFKLFLNGNVMKFNKKLMEFPKDERLHELYFDTICVSRFKKLASVVTLILTLSHGQVPVERGFSQKHNLIQVNMSPDTIISKRSIKGHMLANNQHTPYTITIDP